jgi:hypothetical protein
MAYTNTSPLQRMVVMSITPSDDTAFRLAVERGQWPRAEWTHRAHVRLGYLTLCERSWSLALDNMRDTIRGYNSAQGIPNSLTGGYHETITHAFLRLIHAQLVQHGPAADSQAFCDAHPELLNPHRLGEFYSPARLNSVAAREWFLEPDLQPLPLLIEPLE